MIRKTFYLLLLLATKSYGQTDAILAGGSQKQNEIFLNRMKAVEKAIKTVHIGPILPYLHEQSNIMGQITPEAQKQVFQQMANKFPKSNLNIKEIKTAALGGYIMELDMRPYTAFTLTLDSNYMIKDLKNVSGEEYFDYSSRAFQENVIAIPFTLTASYILIEGEVNGKKGKFMFDTGMPFHFSLNNNYLDLDKQNKVTDGQMGSGQKFELFYQDSLQSLSVSNVMTVNNVKGMHHGDFKFLQDALISDFLGFLGYEMIKQYEFTIDYNKRMIFLHRLDKTGDPIVKRIQKGKKVSVLSFKTEQRQIPVAQFQVGDINMKGHFDTGAPGEMALTEELLSSLQKSGNLMMKSGPKQLGTHVKKISYNGTELLSDKIPVTQSDNIHLSMGYAFLRNYVSVWNYLKKTITLYTN